MSEGKELFTEWKNSVVTQEVFRVLGDLKNTYQERLGNGYYIPEERDRIIGKIQAYNDLLEIGWEEIE